MQNLFLGERVSIENFERDVFERLDQFFDDNMPKKNHNLYIMKTDNGFTVTQTNIVKYHKIPDTLLKKYLEKHIKTKEHLENKDDQVSIKKLNGNWKSRAQKVQSLRTRNIFKKIKSSLTYEKSDFKEFAYSLGVKIEDQSKSGKIKGPKMKGAKAKAQKSNKVSKLDTFKSDHEEQILKLKESLNNFKSDSYKEKYEDLKYYHESQLRVLIDAENHQLLEDLLGEFSSDDLGISEEKKYKFDRLKETLLSSSNEVDENGYYYHQGVGDIEFHGQSICINQSSSPADVPVLNEILESLLGEDYFEQI